MTYFISITPADVDGREYFRLKRYKINTSFVDLIGLAAVLLTEDINSTNPFEQLFFYSVDWTVLQMTFQANSFFQEGFMVTMHDSVVNEQHVLTVGTTYGLVIQFVHLDGKYRRYNTFKIADSPILGLYQHNDSDHTMLVMTKNEPYKYASTRCLEYPGNHCVKSGVMEGRNPHCGWCIYEQRASRKSECSCKTTVCWLSSLTSCITLDSEPRGAQASTGTVDIQLTTSLSLPDGPLYQYLCRWQSGAVKNATRVRSKFTCRMDNTNISNNIQLTLELGVKVINTDSFVLLTEAPFLLYSCSNFEKCGECTLTVGANCTWCPVKGLCRQTSASCSHAVTSSNRTCPQLANHYDQLYLPSGINRSLTINVTNDVLTQYNNIAFRLVTDAVGLNSSCTATSSRLTCLVNVSVNHSKAKNMISVQYSSSANGWTYLDDNHNNKVTIYNCTKLAEEGCNYCKALNSSIYKCAWDSSAHICKYNDNRGARENAICPPPLINEISPKDGPYSGSIITTIMGREFGVIEFKDIDQTRIVVSGKSCSPMQDISFVPPDKHDFELRVRTGITCKAVGLPFVNRTSLIISYQSSILAADFKPLILKNSTITRVYPEFGPRAGGTKITLYGENLGIGNRMLEFVYLRDQRNGVMFHSTSIYETGDGYVIIGTIPIRAESSTIGNASFYVGMNEEEIHTNTVSFTFLDNPVVTDIYPTHGYLSGGTVLTITGENLNHAKLPIIFIRGYEQDSEQCINDDSSTKAFCKVPEAPKDLKQKLETRRRRRATACVGCQEVEIVVKLDGVERSFTLKYYHDPSLSKFNNGMKLFNEDQHFLTVEGDNLTLLATSDVQITIGIEECRVVEVSNTFMRCAAPRKQPKPGISGAEIPEVNVTIGNIRATLGYLKYEVAVKQVALIVGASVGAAVLVIIIVIVAVCVATRKRRANTKAKSILVNKMKKELKDVELEDKIRAQPEEDQPRMKIEHENDSLK
ncbi:hypothetical protein DPMN_017442 [Dreissena polymorpha]|uniref:IPT/TIG domain-containing protein n=3 Tax=Dreissena polymorpha TaxID=45954 RepID=A0A9D4S6D6_DREPO|nr:hypothetical protein DPMN_017442 [Dreissena polymorpha]